MSLPTDGAREQADVGRAVQVGVQLGGQPGGDGAGAAQQQADLPLHPHVGLARVHLGHPLSRGRHTTSAEVEGRSGTRSRP